MLQTTTDLDQPQASLEDHDMMASDKSHDWILEISEQGENVVLSDFLAIRLLIRRVICMTFSWLLV